MRSTLFAPLCIVVMSFVWSPFALRADVDKGDYVAYVDVPYDVAAGTANVFSIGGKKCSITGLVVGLVTKSYADAVEEYEAKYEEVKSILASSRDDGTGLSKAVQLAAASSWKTIVDNALRQGGAEQVRENTRYMKAVSDAIKKETDDRKAQNAAYKAERDNVVGEWKNTYQVWISASKSVSADLMSMRSDVNALKQSTSSELEKVNDRLSQLAQKSDKTEQEVSEMQSLKEQIAQLNTVKTMAELASTKAQEALAEAQKAAVDAYNMNYNITNSIDNITTWLGFKELNGEQLFGQFMTPQLFKQGLDKNGEAAAKKDYYDLKNQTYLTMLSDAGIIPLLTKDGVTRWTELAGKEPNVYMLYDKGESDKKEGLALTGVAKDKLLPIADWVDGTTITINDEGKYTTDANVGATIEAWLNKNKSSGIKGELKGAAAKKGDDNLWSTNNVLNPANPAFDKSNRNNIWNLLAYCGDSDVSPKDAAEGGGSTKALNSIQFLGSYSEAFGNAFSLYGFYKAKSGMFPYVEGADTENTLLWKMELEGGSERDAYSSGNLPDTIEVVKVSDDDSEVVEAEKRRILSLKGFDTAGVGQVAYKKSETELGWTGTDCFKFVGTDGGDGVVVGSGSTTNTVTFASASDSNVKVNVEKSGDDGVKITIGVYYK